MKVQKASEAQILKELSTLERAFRACIDKSNLPESSRTKEATEIGGVEEALELLASTAEDFPLVEKAWKLHITEMTEEYDKKIEEAKSSKESKDAKSIIGMVEKIFQMKIEARAAVAIMKKNKVITKVQREAVEEGLDKYSVAALVAETEDNHPIPSLNIQEPVNEFFEDEKDIAEASLFKKLLTSAFTDVLREANQALDARRRERDCLANLDAHIKARIACKDYLQDVMNGQLKLKKTTLTGYPKGEHPETLATEARIKALFYELDIDHSGYLDKSEVKLLAEKLGDKLAGFLSHKKLDKAFAEMDPNGDGKVTLQEFINWYHRQHPIEPHHVYDKVRRLFDEIDTDKSGYLEKSEVRKLLSEAGDRLTRRFSFKVSYGREGKSFDKAFGEMDHDGDGKINFAEFLTWHCHQIHMPVPELTEEDLAFMISGNDDGGTEVVYPRGRHPHTLAVEAKIKALFYEMDSDRSGDLDKNEVKILAKRMGDKLTTMLSHKLLDKAFAEMDPNGDGKVSLEEFIAWHHRVHPVEPHHVYAQCRKLFDEIDTDNSGYLTRKELKKMLLLTGNVLTRRFSFKHLYGESKESFDEAFGEMDPNGDEQVTFEEFLAWHCRNHHIKIPPLTDVGEIIEEKEESEGPITQEEKYHADTIQVEAHIIRLFREIDVDYSMDLDKSEIKILAQRMGDKLTTMMSHKLLDRAFKEMDRDGNGRVTVDEFIEWHHRTHPIEPKHVYTQVRFLFHEVDDDNSGYVTKKRVTDTT
eukprot:g2157.t1